MYINSKTPLIIYCKSCQEYFKQTPGDHLYNKSGCPKCGHIRTAKSQTFTQEQFINKSKLIYGDTYDYDNVKYTTMHEKIELYCELCSKSFRKLALNHIYNLQGCPRCKVRSKGELAITNILDNINIDYEQEKVLKYENRSLRADIYIPKFNAVIEFD